MGNGPPRSSPFGLHVADRALNPIISSSQSLSAHDTNSQLRRQFQALSTLTRTAINAHDTASRLGLGTPQRIMVETQSSGPIVLTSYLHSPDPGKAPPSLYEVEEAVDKESAGEASTKGLDNGTHEPEELSESENKHRPPLLIATVVASRATEIGESRRSAARLEKIGRDFQREWARKAG